VVATISGPRGGVENGATADGEVAGGTFDAVAVAEEPAVAEADRCRLDVHPLSTMMATTASAVVRVARWRERGRGGSIGMVPTLPNAPDGWAAEIPGKAPRSPARKFGGQR
jgi:hypothetical protein